MATPLGVSNLVDLGGSVLLVKTVKTGYNNPGQFPGTATQVINNASIQNVNAGATLTMTADSHLGVTVQLSAATGSTVTLPAATGTGNQYFLFVSTSVTSNNHVIQAAGSDKIYGSILVSGTASFVGAASNNTTFTMNGTTTGGLKGSSFYFTDMGANLWLVEANVLGSGTAATPISA